MATPRKADRRNEMHLAHGKASRTAVSLLPSELLSQREEAWPPALLVEDRPRFLGSQSVANGMDLLAICPGPCSSEVVPEVEQTV